MAEAPSSSRNNGVDLPPPLAQGDAGPSTPQEPYSVVMKPYTTPEYYTHLRNFQVSPTAKRYMAIIIIMKAHVHPHQAPLLVSWAIHV